MNCIEISSQRDIAFIGQTFYPHYIDIRFEEKFQKQTFKRAWSMELSGIFFAFKFKMWMLLKK